MLLTEPVFPAEVQLIYNVVFLSAAVQLSDPGMRTHCLHILCHYTLFQEIGHSLTRYTVGPRLSILYMLVRTC